MAAAGTAVDPDRRRVAVPRGRLRLEPAHAVVGILHAGGIGRFRRERHVDRDDQQAAGRERAIHRFLGMPILRVPRAAMEIEHRRERPRAGRLIDAGHQRASGRGAPELHVAHADLERRRGVVARRRTGGDGVGGPDRRAGGRDCLEKVPAARIVGGHTPARPWVVSVAPFGAKIIASSFAGCVWLALPDSSWVAPGCS